MPETIDVTKIIVTALGLVGLVFTTFLIPYIWAKIKKTNKEGEATQLYTIKDWVRFAVEAAEMLFKGPGRGAEKLDYVMDYITRLLAEKGITMDQQQVRMMIESTLLELKNSLLK